MAATGGLSPPPWPSERRSFRGPGSAPVALRGGRTSEPTTRTIRRRRAARATGESYSAVQGHGPGGGIAPGVVDRDRRAAARRQRRARPEAAARVRLDALVASADHGRGGQIGG